jgi:hypothetical protein
MMMRIVFKTRWLLPLLLIGLAVLFVKLPTSAVDQALAGTSLTTEKSQAQVEDVASVVDPPQAEAQVDESVAAGGAAPDAAQAEFDDSTCGTY